MMRARRVSPWSGRYLFTMDGLRVATWDKASWNAGGSLDLDGYRYAVRSDLWGRNCTMIAPGGVPVAAAHRVGRRDWTIEADGATYHFRGSAPWRQAEELRVEGCRVGSVRRANGWSRDVFADLPGLPLVVEAFALAVVTIKWDLDAVV